MLDMTQSQLARRAGLAIGTVRKLEAYTGDVDGHEKTIERVHKVLREMGIDFLTAQETIGVRLRLRDQPESFADAGTQKSRPVAGHTPASTKRV
jgi:predicted transcriptional regulator